MMGRLRSTDCSSRQTHHRAAPLLLVMIVSPSFRVAIAGAVLSAAVAAFSAAPSRHSRPAFLRTTSLASDFGSDFGSAMPKLGSPFERIGIQEDELAMGVDPEEFITYFGSKEDLIEKTMADLPKFDRETATKAVETFLLDKEALDYYITYEKKKAEDPEFGKVKEEGFFSFRTLVIAYIVYVFGNTLVLPQVRNYIAAQEAAGTWQGTNIPFIDKWISEMAVQVSAATASDAVQAVKDAVQSTGALQ